jgi:surfeit locus 1 family protein
MAKDPTEPDIGSWVPTGLKVRSSAPVAKPSKITRDALELEPVFDSNPTTPQRRTTDFVQAHDSAPAPSKGTNDGKAGFRPMLILSILTLICLGILFSLGQWQWDKYIAKTKAPTQTVAIEPTSVAAALEATHPEYRSVIVEGLADPRTIKISVVQNGVRGYRLLSPVVMEAGGIFVDRGFIDEIDVARAIAPTGQVRLTGVLRKGARPNRYTPDNDPVGDFWSRPQATNIMLPRPQWTPLQQARQSQILMPIAKAPIK